MTVKKNILIMIKNKTASPKAKPPLPCRVVALAKTGCLLPIILTSLGEAASTTKNQKLRTKNYQALCASHSETATGYIPYGIICTKKKQVKNKWDKWDKWDSGVSSSTIHCLLWRYKTPVAGWNGQTISNVCPTSTKRSGTQVGQQWDS